MATSGNHQMVSLWNSDAASAWAAHPERYDEMLAPFSDLVLDAADLQPGERVLDVGCGAGQLSLAAATAVGSGGAVTGVDVARPLLALAAERAADARLAATTTFVEADAQVHPFAEPVDAVISRFGVMFFADPVAAFANLLTATAPGGRLAFACWQQAPANEWVLTALMAVVPHVDAPQLPPPGSPGPFALGDADHARAVLEQAGWRDVALEPVTTRMTVGGRRGVDGAVDFYVEDTFGRLLLEGASPDRREAAIASLRAALEPHVDGGDGGGVTLGAAVWLATASRPG